MKVRLKKSYSKRVLASLCVIALLFVALVVSVSSSHNLGNFFASAADDRLFCSSIPAGTYKITLTTYAAIPWNVTCPWLGGHWSGKIPAGSFAVGSFNTPTIYSGRNYSENTTLDKICSYVSAANGNWKDICKVCKFIKCAKAKVSFSLAVGKIQCTPGVYNTSGNGKAVLTYADNLLGACSANASYTGTLTGRFVGNRSPIE